MIRIAKWTGIILASIVALAVILILGLNTSPGRRFVVDRLAGLETASGISIHAGRIDGSLYGRMTIRNLRVNDSKGTFLESPALTIDWRPFAYLHSRIDVRELTAGSVLLRRNPMLKATPSDPNAPILPDIDLTIGRLAIGRLVLEKPVTGRKHILRLAGSATIADQRARIQADGDALVEAGVAGGDRLHVALDAAPDRNLLAMDAHLAAPAGGLVDSYAGLGKALTLDLGGQGDWAHWKGRLSGRAGDETLADLAVTGVDGTFHTLGTVRPSILLGNGAATRLTEPGIRIDLTTKLVNRTSDTRLTASSDAFALTAAGLIDLGRSRLSNLRIDARLLTPGAIAPNVAGKDVALVAMIDGPMATPTIDYRLSAAALSFGATGLQGLNAAGKATIDDKRIAVPLHATVARVTGLDAAAGGALTAIRLDGDVVYQDGKIATDNLKLASPRIDATAIVVADVAKGTYVGALKGRVNDYLVDGLGHIALTTDARLVPGLNRGFAIKGHVRAVTRRFTNATIAEQLGGAALVDADVGYDLSGGATVSNLRLVSRNLRITGGQGFYRMDGRLGFRATGRSVAYGPFALDASGTIARPVARLRAASPGLGVGIANVEAVLTGTAAGYHIVAKGGSDYGPLGADVMLRSGRGPTTIDIAQASFAGVQLKGTVTQMPAGPFAGTLTLAGSGLDGSIRLAALGKDQKADIDMRASAARLPGPTPIVIGSGTVQASVVLTPQGPNVNGRFALVNLGSGPLLIGRAQGRIDYRQGSGLVQLVVAGSSGVPFDLAAQARLGPTRVIANLKGSANGIPFQLARPATMTKLGATWTLQPATIVLPQGQVDLSGSYGAAINGHTVLRSIDLSIADAFAPSLGLSGKASGTVDYAGGRAVPDVRARIDVAGFQRTAALTVSDPVDIAMLGTLNAGGGDVRALIRRNGATFGRVAAKVAPLGAGASLSQRIMSAPLSGGIRYSGPAEILWAFGGLGNQQLSGPIAIGADFGGRVASPSLSGVIRANQLRYENGSTGTVLTNLTIDGRFTQSALQLAKLTANAGRGTLSASGNIGLDAARGFPIDIQARLDNAQLAKSDAMGATVTGALRVTNDRNGGLIQGDLRLPEVRYQIVRQGAAQVTDLTGVRRKGAQPVSRTAGQSLPSNWKLDIHVRANDHIFVSGMGLEAEWRTDMHIGGTATTPSVTGRLEVVRGTFSFASRRFDLDRGIITFQGPPTNPALDISASTTATDVTATITIGGYAQNPQLTFTSTPALPQDEVLSRLLFGTSVTSLSPMQAIQLASALNGLRPGSGKGLNPLGKLRSVAGIDRLRVLGADESTGRGTSLAAGKYISRNIYVEIITDTRGFTATQLEISLSRALALLSSTGSFGGSNIGLRYKKDY